MIRFENVGMRYGMGTEVLQDVSFVLRPGSFHFLTGPSGAGKTSLLKLLYLAHRPSRGLIHFDGMDVVTAPRKALPALRRRIGVVYQDFRLLNHMTALENVALSLVLGGTKKSEALENARELLSWVGLSDRINARPPTLSGGEKQRLAIARAVVGRPDLLLADEPTGNVDPEMADRLMRLLVELNRLGTTTVIATHDPELIRKFPAPVMALNAGALTIIEAGGHHVA